MEGWLSNTLWMVGLIIVGALLAVRVAPTDYGRDPVFGTLVHAGAHETVIARDTAETGRVHVHFPKQGFRITPAGD